MDREQLDTWCERSVLGLVLAILGFSALATGATRPQDFAIVQWLTVALLVVWLARFFINPKHRLLWTPVCWPALAFVAYAVGRYFTADVEYLARQELVRVVVYAAVFFAVINNLHKQEPAQTVGLGLVFLAMGIAMYAVFQYLTDSDYVWGFLKEAGYRKRGSGTFINPNHLAGYLGMVLPLAVAFTLTGRFSYVMKIVLGYASVVIFAGITVTFSRGGWVAAAVALVGLFFWMVRQRDYWKQALIMLGVMIGIFALAVTKASMSPNRHERFTQAHEIEDVRFQLWDPAMQMWKDHLWFGVGPDHFDTRFREYRPAHFAMQFRPGRVHNDYLNTLVDWGLVGGILVLGCWLAFYFQVFHGWKFVQRSQSDLASKRSNKTSFVLGGALGLLAMLVHAFTDFNMHVPANALLAVTIMALVASHYRFASERYWYTVRLPLRCAVYPVLMAALIFLATQSWRRTVESIRMARVSSVHRAIQRESSKATPERLAELAREQVAALEAAVAADPNNFEAAYELGEALRLQSFVGLAGYEALAERAMSSFKAAAAANPYYPYPALGEGMCLHWLKRHAEAGPFFDRARRLDPNGYFTLARLGWHEFQKENYETAIQVLEQSISLCSNPKLNQTAWSYFEAAKHKVAETAGNPVRHKP